MEVLLPLLLLLLAAPPPSQQLDLDYCQDSLGVGLPNPHPANVGDDDSAAAAAVRARPRLLPDSAFSASSSFDRVSVGPHRARLHLDDGGGAWCPSRPVGGGAASSSSASSTPIKDGDAGGAADDGGGGSLRRPGEEFLQIDLGNLTVITRILTQGRFGKGLGREYAEAFSVEYWRQGMHGFKRYRDIMGREVLPGNANTYSVRENSLTPSIVASKLRILPRPMAPAAASVSSSSPSSPPRTVCMRLGLEGCPFNEGVVSYSMPQGAVRGRRGGGGGGAISSEPLELVDHTFDGREDSASGHLRAGLGQLVDGRFGGQGGALDHAQGYDWVGWKKSSSDALSSPPVSLVFTFDVVRAFGSVDIFVDNHYTRDVQVFREAKIYFSNEEDKFGDDRRVDFEYMPDVSIELARNVSVKLHGQHGKFVMLQLYFQAKWILVSEITFVSEPYVEKPYPTQALPPSTNEVPSLGEQDSQDLVLISERSNDDDPSPRQSSTPDPAPATPSIVHHESGGVGGGSRGNSDAGIVIGILLFVILALLFAILYVVARGKEGLVLGGSGKAGAALGGTPSHSLLTKRLTDRFNLDYRPCQDAPPATSTSSKTTLYGLRHHQSAAAARARATSTASGAAITTDPNSAASCAHTTQETIYEELGNADNLKLYASSGFLSLNRKFSSDPVLSEDNDDDYAEPVVVTSAVNVGQMVAPSTSFSENIYAQAVTTPPRMASSSLVSSPARRALALKPLPLSHYARPMTPPTPPTAALPSQWSPAAVAALVGSPLLSRRRSSQLSSEPPLSAQISPPKYSTLVAASSPPAPPVRSTAFRTLDSNANKSAAVVAPRLVNPAFLAAPALPSPASSLASSSVAPKADVTTTEDDDDETQDDLDDDDVDDNFAYYYASADVSIPSEQDLAGLYKQIDDAWRRQQQEQEHLLQQPQPRQQRQQQQRLNNSNSLERIVCRVDLEEIPRSRLHRLEKLGEGQFGEIHLCSLSPGGDNANNRTVVAGGVVAVKELRRDCNDAARLDFETEARVLTSLSDANLVRVLGVCLRQGDPLAMVCEYGALGDLCHFLQDHVADTAVTAGRGAAAGAASGRTLSYGRLVHMAAQIASGMKYLEALNFVHRDLATRNCLVCADKTIKISDFGLSRPCFRRDYFRSQSGCLLPVRWMAWESVLLGRYTAKSDVWSFGVTLWEVLTLARERPFEQMSNEAVVANLSSMYRPTSSASTSATSFRSLPRPRSCPREVADLMEECWRRDAAARPAFAEIHLFLQRKNLGYSPADDDDDLDVGDGKAQSRVVVDRLV